METWNQHVDFGNGFISTLKDIMLESRYFNTEWTHAAWRNETDPFFKKHLWKIVNMD